MICIDSNIISKVYSFDFVLLIFFLCVPMQIFVFMSVQFEQHVYVCELSSILFQIVFIYC